jgi:H+/Cl- antiporter ClcA
MRNIGQFLKERKHVPLFVLKWAAIVLAIGALGGAIGAVFRMTIAYVTGLREVNGWILWLLPAAGVAIAVLYRLTDVEGHGTDDVLVAARSGTRVPALLAPVIFVATALTHFAGGSAGREGAALQLGGGIGNWIGRGLRLSPNGMRVITLCGMAAVFAALFGTPVTAAVFVVECATVGAICYSGFLPALGSALTACGVASLFGFSLQHYTVQQFPDLTAGTLGAAAVVAAACGLVSIVFCVALHRGGRLAQRAVRNPMLRAALGGVLVIGLTYLVGTGDYNGAGEEVIRRAIAGEAAPAAFAFKLLFTVVTITAGFKGGEIVPCFFIGATLGCVLAPLLGLPASFGASLGLVTLFCGAVNCPVASMILSVELFGAQGIVFYALACAVSYVVSGNFSLYGAQILVSSKLSLKAENLQTK